MELTPRSKVNAMLAALDSSDDEIIPGSARQNLMSRLKKAASPNQEIAAKKSQSTKDNEEHREDVASQSSDDDEEIITKPKGRLASRMKAAIGNEDEEPAANNPRDRVRKLLQKKTTTEVPAATDEDRNTDDSDTPVVSRKRKSRTPPRETPKSSPQKDSYSPGLFVTPDAPRSTTPGNASDSDDLPLNPTSPSNKRFQELVEKKRQERREREEQAKREKAEKLAERRRQAALVEGDDNDDSEDEGGRRLTQQVRPTRKASKKAIEEMHRETQRMSRNMQLAHQAKTKKKITKESLFAKFNYKQPVPDVVSSDPVRPPSSSSAQPPDTEMRETPPSSPPPEAEDSEKQGASELPQSKDAVVIAETEELPTLEDALENLPSSPPSRMDKGKGKAIDVEPAQEVPEKKSSLLKQRPIQIRPGKGISRASELDDSDSDIEIVSAKASKRNAKLDAIFDRIPAKQAKEPHSMVALRMLAHLTSPGKQNSGRNKKPSMTARDLQMNLQLRARQQATREREERLQALRDRGIIVQTAEERAKEMAEVDDLLAKARQEGEEIKAREKAAAKKERKINGEEDPLGDSSDDEDWEEDQAPEEEAAGLGSEDDEHEDSENEDSEEDEEVDEDETPNPMFDNEAGEDDAEDSETDLSIKEDPKEPMDLEDDEDELLPVHQTSRRSRVAKVISDDEDEEDIVKQTPKAPRTRSPTDPRTDSPAMPTSVFRSAKRTFIPGVTVAGPAGLGLTQIFAGTMDDSQDLEVPTQASQPFEMNDGSPSFLRKRNAAPELPPFVPTMSEEESQDMVMDSQTQVQESQMNNDTQGIQISFDQSQINGFDSLIDNQPSTQMSDFPPTQDGGFQMMTPIKGRFVDPPSTVGTVRVSSQMDQAAFEAILESPIMKKKGKLRRRAQVAAFSDDEEGLDPFQENVDEDEEFGISSNAFDVMRKASKKKKAKVVDDFDKKKSDAKNMVNEQAEESEDEYAGLGGASDDESGGEEDAFVKEMIDDEKKDIDENELARFYADRERANDEKQIEKLYKDISKGMLRRKRGADYDLSDSDDGGEARQRRKRAEFAKMRKALLADERIGKIAENPKKQAFLRAIEDRGSDDEMGFLDDFAENDEETSESQSQTQTDGTQQEPGQDKEVMGPPKRKRSDDADYVRPPPNLRRTNASKKPSNLAEIRQSVSSLIEEPNAMVNSLDPDSESDDDLVIEGGPEQKNKENRDPFAIRRTDVSIIDRISLKRANSSNLSNNERLAFAAPSSAPGFKVPPLLRKATTNSSIVSTSSVGGMSTTERMAGGKEGEGIRKGASKNSGVNYFARESERRAAIEKNERRREQKKFKGVEGRRKVALVNLE
ncbi:MRC1-like domain-containing protein [Rutstroemia sp. NJR-2017a BBW]|nr:MRC1-like domain-containing protein [Rutstroemia sp. NJR-2017a BBW]